MRLALCLEFPLHQHGGVEVLVCALLEELSEHHEIHLVSNDHEHAVLTSAHGDLIRSHFHWNPEDLGGTQVNRLLEWATGHEIELFHFHLGGSYAWNARSWSNCAITRCARAGFPCLTTNHQALSPFDARFDSRPLARRLTSFLMRWPGKARQLSSVHREIHVSLHDLRIGKSLFPFHRSKLDQIYHSRLGPLSSLETSQRNNTKIILNLATIAFRKGQHILAEAFARIAAESPEWTLHLVGYHAEPSCVEQIKRIAQDHKIEHRIHLPGSTPNPLELLKSAEIYVQPSLLEGLGLSLQEAMLHGCACVGSGTGGIPELIHDPSVGIIFKTGDVSALADVLRNLIRDENLRRKLGESARASILSRGMTRQAMAFSYEKHYTKMIQPI
ncbi:MAG: glycosyltransferase family 4 protein [Armatimonadetes bacterium]|nr:glycosyltransferase family 4 protein [Akkermansiaceae bacterium]